MKAAFADGHRLASPALLVPFALGGRVPLLSPKIAVHIDCDYFVCAQGTTCTAAVMYI